MTPLSKPITRRTIGTHRGRRLVVSLESGDLIGVRHERTRRVFYLPLCAVYDAAVRADVLARKAAKRKGKT